LPLFSQNFNLGIYWIFLGEKSQLLIVMTFKKVLEVQKFEFKEKKFGEIYQA